MYRSIYPIYPIYLSIYLSIDLYRSQSISIYLYLSLSISIYLYLYLSLSISIYLYLSLSISISISIYYVYLSLSISISISIYVYLSLSLSLSVSIYLYLSLSISIYPCLSRSTPIYLSTYLSIYLFIYLPVYLSTCLSVYLSIYIYIYTHSTYMIVYVYFELCLNRKLQLFLSFRPRHAFAAHSRSDRRCLDLWFLIHHPFTIKGDFTRTNHRFFVGHRLSYLMNNDLFPRSNLTKKPWFSDLDLFIVGVHVRRVFNIRAIGLCWDIWFMCIYICILYIYTYV